MTSVAVKMDSVQKYIPGLDGTRCSRGKFPNMRRGQFEKKVGGSSRHKLLNNA
jgi:hypothetical protein